MAVACELYPTDINPQAWLGCVGQHVVGTFFLYHTFRNAKECCKWLASSCRGAQSRLEPYFPFFAVLRAFDEEDICLTVFVPLQP